MYCTKCGKQNPDDAQVCRSCGAKLIPSTIQATGLSIKTSGMAIAAFVLGLLSIFTCALTAIPAIILGIVSLVRIEKSGGSLTGRGFVIAGLFISCVTLPLMAFLMIGYWRIDAPPIPDDYTIEDMRSAPAQYNQSYELLKSLDSGDEYLADAYVNRLSLGDVNKYEQINYVFKKGNLDEITEQLRHYEQDILSIWDKAQKGRDIFVKLDSFPEIADLKEVNLDFEKPWIIGLRRMIFLYRDYICLKSCNGNHEIAVKELMRLDSIARKISLNARSHMMKMICIAWFRVDIQSANFIINEPQTPEDVLLVLKQHFSTFSKEHTSLRNMMIYDYLSHKNHLMNIAEMPRVRYSPFSTLRLNSTLRLLRNFFDKFIVIEDDHTGVKKFRVWPAIYPNLPVSIGEGGKLPWFYKIYNPMGSKVIEIITPLIWRIDALMTRLEIHSHLLQIVLDKRLGEDVSLEALAYIDEYIVDVENKKILSPGPDGEEGTKDDIFLRINPDVLGWHN